MIYLKHIWTVIKHRWYVGRELLRYGLVWRAITHDLSKLSISEYKGYSYWFYDPMGIKCKDKEFDNQNDYNYHLGLKVLFNRSWDHHKAHNKHHWQYWIYSYNWIECGDSTPEQPKYNRGDPTYCIEMPMKYAIEMVCDWIGAGLAYTGKRDILEWYDKNKNDIYLNEKTQQLVEKLMLKSEEQRG